MKARFEHIKQETVGGGWVEYDIQWVKKHWWSKWKMVMDIMSCPMLYNMKHYDENGNRL